jgi:hypothetical protein
MNFIAGWTCPGSLKKCFQMWLYALMYRSIINARIEFLTTLMDVVRANDLNLYFEFVDFCITLIKVCFQHIVSCIVLKGLCDPTDVSKLRVSAPNRYECSIGGHRYQVHKLFLRCHVWSFTHPPNQLTNQPTKPTIQPATCTILV